MVSASSPGGTAGSACSRLTSFRLTALLRDVPRRKLGNSRCSTAIAAVFPEAE